MQWLWSTENCAQSFLSNTLWKPSNIKYTRCTGTSKADRQMLAGRLFDPHLANKKPRQGCHPLCVELAWRSSHKHLHHL